MPFTSSTSEHLAGSDKTVRYVLELRTNFAQSSSWLEYAIEDFTLTRESAGGLTPATLSISLLNDKAGTAEGYSNERSPLNRVQLFAETRLTAVVGAQNPESEVLFYGRVFRIEPQDFSFTLLCQDWLALCAECECELSLAPQETAELPLRQLFLTGGGAFGSVWGYAYSGPGDPAFNADSPAGTRRRSFAPGNIRLYYDSAGMTEVAPALYQVNLSSGTLSILEDTSGKSYFVTGVRCYLEGSLDWAQVFAEALSYPKTQGGIGAQGTELDLPDTGIDVVGPLYFKGRVDELLRQILERQQANLRLWYDSASARFTLRVVQQKGPGNEDWTLLAPQSIAQPRDLAALYSRVVLTGTSERVQNALTFDSTTISNLVSTGNWFAWDGLNVGPDGSFAAIAPLLYDGDVNTAASVHNLAASVPPGTEKYDSWYPYVQIDLGSPQRISRIRAVTPGSRNFNAAAGHQGHFWPGLRVETSLDGSDWRLASALLCGRYPPRERLEAAGRDLLAPRARYVRVLLGAYKHGFDNQSDPSIGLASLEVYVGEEYRVVKEIDGAASPATHYTYTADYDRDGSLDTWQRNAPGLWQRLGGDSITGTGGRHRTYYEDLAGELNEYLAHDRAIDRLAESLRLFQQLQFQSVSDPRVKLYETVLVPDLLNGAEASGALSVSMLVERLILRPAGTEIGGTDYRGEVL